MANQIVSLFRYITRLRGLPQPEEEVLQRISSGAAEQRMLDIEVGSGRTTPHFAPHFFEYVGIDADESSVRACRKRYAKTLDTGHFDVCDVRSMKKFRDGTFDFVLYSSGLDDFTESDREVALAEIRRVAKNGARFLVASASRPRLEAAGFRDVEVLPDGTRTYYFCTAS